MAVISDSEASATRGRSVLGSDPRAPVLVYRGVRSPHDGEVNPIESKRLQKRINIPS